MPTKMKRIEFKIFAPAAKQVLLAGSFNRWSNNSDPMAKDRTGTWKKIKVLPPGTHEYKFIIDGVWTLDPSCPDILRNQEGIENNVIEV